MVWASYVKNSRTVHCKNVQYVHNVHPLPEHQYLNYFLPAATNSFANSRAEKFRTIISAHHDWGGHCEHEKYTQVT
jgi:hypothetical protein